MLTGWDLGGVTHVFASVLSTYADTLFPPNPTAIYHILTPGCGRGYDVIHEAGIQNVAKSHGVDLAETGIAEARAYLESGSLTSDVKEKVYLYSLISSNISKQP